ncbi:unnamed protein product [Prunus armeniaca]|uniref:Uncharacterized protein n=1 Tax=Prunus armeniaca TaxID=36596 RepID=A0A6J5XFY0_PRUAR|nr:unnamed protein product [Prunus armeniaca]CAB4312846.1 unnamed protein product [Prunus armeniaca]
MSMFRRVKPLTSKFSMTPYGKSYSEQRCCPMHIAASTTRRRSWQGKASPEYHSVNQRDLHNLSSTSFRLSFIH